MPALVLFGRRLLIASDDIPLFALPAALFHTFWTVALVTVLLLYSNQPLCTDEGMYLPFLGGAAGAFALSSAIEWALVAVGLRGGYGRLGLEGFRWTQLPAPVVEPAGPHWIWQAG